MHFDRPLIFLDLESTGLDVSKDRVIQFGWGLLLGGEPLQARTQFVNPGRPIPEAATKLTGITDATVARAPSFKDRAQMFAEIVNTESHYLVGFGLLAFDIPLLAEEFLRVGIDPPIDPSRVIDCGVLFKRREERTLAAALKFYCGRDPEKAHDAGADVVTTGEVFAGQMARYGIATLEDAVKASHYEDDRRIDYAGKLSRNAKGEPTYNFGSRTKGMRVCDDLGFAHWMLDRDFPLDTKRKLTAILEQLEAAAVSNFEPA